MSQPAISKHLKVLERAGLISRGRDAQRRPCRLEGAPLRDVNKWVERYREFWEASFDALDGVLEDLKKQERGAGGTAGLRPRPGRAVRRRAGGSKRKKERKA